MGSLVDRTLTLGEKNINIRVADIKNPDPVFYAIAGFYGKGINQALATKSFSRQVRVYASDNKYNFIFSPRDIKKEPEEIQEYGDLVTRYICQGNVLFMKECPLEVSKEEYQSLLGKISIDEFLELIRDRGGNPQPLNSYRLFL